MNQTRLRPWFYLAPAVILLGLVFLYPLLLTVYTSFRGYTRLGGYTDQIGLQNYVAFLSDPFNLEVLWITIKIGTLTTIACALLGYPIALQFARSSSRGRGIIALLVLSPLLVNVVVRTYGWVAILGPNGLFERTMHALGIADPPQLFFSETAVVIGLTHLLLAFMVLGIVSALDNINPALVLAARNLGASSFGAFWKITLPLSIPGLVSGSFLVFTHACGSLITPALLGGNSGVTLPTLIYQQELTLFNWPLGSAMSLILLLVIGASLFLYSGLLHSVLKRREIMP